MISIFTVFSFLSKALIALFAIKTGKELSKIPNFIQRWKLRKNVQKLLVRNRTIDSDIAYSKRQIWKYNIFDFSLRKNYRRLISSLKKEKKVNLREIQDSAQLFGFTV